MYNYDLFRITKYLNNISKAKEDIDNWKEGSMEEKKGNNKYLSFLIFATKQPKIYLGRQVYAITLSNIRKTGFSTTIFSQ